MKFALKLVPLQNVANNMVWMYHKDVHQQRRHPFERKHNRVENLARFSEMTG